MLVFLGLQEITIEPLGFSLSLSSFSSLVKDDDKLGSWLVDILDCFSSIAEDDNELGSRLIVVLDCFFFSYRR
jgi:hypothetical protein